MSRIAVVIGSLVSNTAAYAASVVNGAAAKKQTGYMPFPWDHDDDGCES